MREDKYMREERRWRCKMTAAPDKILPCVTGHYFDDQQTSPKPPNVCTSVGGWGGGLSYPRESEKECWADLLRSEGSLRA